MSMYELLTQASGTLGRPIVDQTGLKGRYDFRIDVARMAANRQEPIDRVAMLITTLQEQLGLKVDSRKDWVDILVIDYAEKILTGN